MVFKSIKDLNNEFINDSDIYFNCNPFFVCKTYSLILNIDFHQKYSKMGSICKYLCCGCCDDRIDKRKLRKENLKILKEITPNSKHKIPENPLSVKSSEMTDYYKIPNTNQNFYNESDVLRSMGYQMGSQIARGGYGTVFTALHIEKRLPIALKKIPIPEGFDTISKSMRTSRLTDIKNEVYILQKTDHPNVIKMIQHFIIVERNQQNFYILMQKAVGGDLSSKLDHSGPFEESVCRRWFAQMLSGLNYMHLKGLAHRDLKLGNILLDEAQDILISDFGLSRFVWRQNRSEIENSHTFCGTPPYMAPEVIIIEIKKEYSYGPGYNAFAADIWSLGIILFKLFNKRYPFFVANGSKGLAKALKLMKAKRFHFNRQVSPPEQMKDMIQKMLEPVVAQRISIKELTRHPWIIDQFNKVEEKNSKRSKKS